MGQIIPKASLSWKVFFLNAQIQWQEVNPPGQVNLLTAVTMTKSAKNHWVRIQEWMPGVPPSPGQYAPKVWTTVYEGPADRAERALKIRYGTLYDGKVPPLVQRTRLEGYR